VAHGLLGDPTHLEPIDVRHDAVVLEVEPGAEGPTRPGEHHHPGVVLLGDGVEGVVQLRHQLDRHGVETIGPVHPHHCQVRAGVLYEHEGWGVGHGPGT